MKRTTCCSLLLLLSVAWAYQIVNRPAPPEADQRLTLSTPRPDYLLGEPVVLDLTFRNNSKETMRLARFCHSPHYYAAPVWIAGEAGPFEKYVPNESTAVPRMTGDWIVKAGDALKFQYRIVASPWTRSGLAFPKPGPYRVYVDCPLTDMPSNVVEVRIKEPVGEDRKVWRELNQERFLTFLQAQAMHNQPAVAMKILDLLEAHPTSGYALALRYTLGKVYFRERFGLAKGDRKRLGSALGIDEVASFQDKRLRAQMKQRGFDVTNLSVEEIDVKLQTPLAAMLREMSAASGVKLDAAPDLKSSVVQFNSVIVEECMKFQSDQLEACWERRGDGYFLVPFQADPAKAADQKGRNRP